MPSDSTSSLTGQTIDRRYEVERLLGTGGMGEVYLALDERTGGRVVLKAPWPGMLLDDPGLRNRFIREIRVMSRLDHPNIIKVYDVVEHEGRPVAVMQYLSGGDLEAQSKLPVDRWLPQIASALDYLHLNKLVHRDVKPANIFFDSHKTPYLGDFGIVKALQGSGTAFATLHGGTQTGFALGTPKYMSPEAVEGRELDGRSDQYALAIMVYERLAGRMPFDAETPAHIFVAHMTMKPQSLSEIDSRHGKAISEVLNRALAKRPEERFGGCREFGKAVLKALIAAPSAKEAEPLEKKVSPPTPEPPAVVPTPTPQPAGPIEREVPYEEASVQGATKLRLRTVWDAISVLPWPVWAATAGVAVILLLLAFVVLNSGSARSPDRAHPLPVEGGPAPQPAVAEPNGEPSKLATASEPEESPPTSEPNGEPSELATAPEPEESPPTSEPNGEPSKLATAPAPKAPLPPKKPTEEVAPLEEFAVSFTVREEDASGALVEGALVEVFSRESADGPAQSLGRDNSDTRGRVSLVLRPTAAQQSQGDFAATVRLDKTSKTYRLEGFPETQRFSLYLPKTSPPPLAVAPFSAQQARGHQDAWAEHLGKPRELENSLGMKLVLIPPGEFMMGSPEWEKDRHSHESPEHRVRITKPFYLGVYEVTQGEYERVVGTNPSYFLPGGGGSDRVSGQNTSRFPVENVSWNDAVEFCRKLSALPGERSVGREYRLPTEAEWEYACRAGTTTRFHFGNDLSSDQARFGQSWSSDRPVPVGSYSANGFGLYDMHGNGLEWCADRYGSGYYANSPVDDPQGLASGSYRAYRGGYWSDSAWGCRSAYRRYGPVSRREVALGFRLALVLADE